MSPFDPGEAPPTASTTPAELEAFLRRHGIAVEFWGQGEAKTVQDLARELRDGDSVLTVDPLRRRVRVAQVEIQRPAADGDLLVLVEAAQIFGDGRRRERGLLPSEKMRPDEEPVAGALRCLEEELGVDPERVEVLPGIAETTQEGDSPSYPGLVTRYVFYRVSVRCEGLPTEAWESEEQAAGDAVTRHLWEWRARDL